MCFLLFFILLFELVSSLTHTVIKFPTKLLHSAYLNFFGWQNTASKIEVVMIMECFLT